MHICLQKEDFNHHQEYQALCKDSPNIGAIVTFCGLVREFANGQGNALFIEHFPEMAEKQLSHIIQQAKKQWPIINVRLIHRFGHLSLGEQIVFVGASSAHREAAFQACEFIMDFLKVEAPFWKKAVTTHNEYWVDANQSDYSAKERWLKN